MEPDESRVAGSIPIAHLPDIARLDLHFIAGPFQRDALVNTGSAVTALRGEVLQQLTRTWGLPNTSVKLCSMPL